MVFAAKVPKRILWVCSILLFLLLFITMYRVYFFYHFRAGNQALSGKTLLLGLRYDARMLSILGLVMLALSSFKRLNIFTYYSAVKFWNVFLALTVSWLMFFYVADFFHYDYLHQRLSASVVNYLGDAAISFGMVWQTYPVVTIVVLMVVFLFAIMWLHKLLLNFLSRKKIVYRRMIYKGYYLITVLVMAVFVFGKIGQYPLRWSDAFSLGDDFKSNAALNPFQSFFSSMQFKNSRYDIKEVRQAYPLMAEYFGVLHPDSNQLNYQRNTAGSRLPVTPPNIIIVICESFSAYKSSMFGNKLNPTPFFASLCDRGVFFERCFTPAFGTARGVWAVVTGIPDVESPKTASRNPAAVDQFTIMNEFTGYEKSYFLGGSTTWANIRGLLQNNISGLEIYEEGSYNAAKVDVWGISDKNLFLEANAILSKKSAPFISIIQTADNHRPYTIPAEDEKILGRVKYPADTLKKYGFDDNEQLNAFRYTDYCFKAFMDAASREKYFNNTVFVFVGDHGLRGDAGDLFPLSFTRQGILAEHVPLLFYSPGILPAKRITTVCSQLDILPSVASIAGISYRNRTMGKNLFDTAGNSTRYAFIADPDLATMGLVNDSFYYVRYRKTGKEELVSVLNNQPVIDQHGSVKAEMKKLTHAWYVTAQYMLLNNSKNSVRPSHP